MNRTVERTFSILQFVAASESGATLQEIADEVDMPKSSAFVIVHSLLELNYIKSADQNDKKYCLGIEAFKLGTKYLDKISPVQQCAHVLPDLAERHSRTAFMAVLNGADVVYLYKYVASNAHLAACDIGSSKPAYVTALGKAIMAFLPRDKQLSVIDKTTFTAYTPHTIISKDALLQELEKTRQLGYATEHGEFTDLTFCCAAPIFDYTGNVVGSVSLADIFKENEDEALVAADLMSTAGEISRALGYIPR